MRNGKFRGFFRLGWMTAAAALLFLGLMMGQAKAPVDEGETADLATRAPSASAAQSKEAVKETCQIVQTMAFSRCGHSVTRRVEAPQALLGKDFAAAREYYSLWQLESFSASQIVMRREIALFCPMHAVLGVNEAGETVLCRNVYGDGMAALKTYRAALEDFSGEDQELLLLGIGFDSEAEADAWVARESGES